MTRSTSSLALALSLPFASIPQLGCSKPAHVDRAPPPPDILAEIAPDLRRPAAWSTPGEDVTELARAENAPGKEPPLPTRHGVATRTPRTPHVPRTAEGFVAHLPGARAVATPAHHDGNLVVGGFGTYEVYALAAATGRPAWGLHLSDDGPTDPACKEGICVFNTYSCTLFGVSAATGKPLWSWYLGSPQLATVLVDGELVFSSYPHAGNPSSPYVIAAFDLKTGAPRWRRWIDAEVNSTPVSDGKRLYVATKVGTLYQLATEDGEVLAAHRNRVTSAPVLTADGVYLGRERDRTRDNDMLASSLVLLPTLEKRENQGRVMVKPAPRPLVARGGLFTIEQGAVVATNRKTGRRMWERPLGAEAAADVPSPLAYAGKSILLATSSGSVLRIEPDTGVVVDGFAMKHGPIASQPIAVDGWLYAGTTQGDLVAVDTGDPELTGWDMLGGGPDRRGSADEGGT